MKLEARKSLHDVLGAAREIQGFIVGLGYDGFQSNEMIQAAVERKFEIIGEALRRLDKAEPEILNHISNHRNIIGFRNIIAHGYDNVDAQIVWEAATSYLPILIAEVEPLTAEDNRTQ